jgi:hypothetical protein
VCRLESPPSLMGRRRIGLSAGRRRVDSANPVSGLLVFAVEGVTVAVFALIAWIMASAVLAVF